jgi:AraC-like DNA-binding protein
MPIRKINPERIPALIASGLSAAEIAGELGCTEGSLRVRCSQLKISLRRASAHGVRYGTAISRISASVAVQGPVTRTAASGARRTRKIDPKRIPLLLNRGMTPAEIAAEFGCTLGTLRVRCSRLQISLRRCRNTFGQSPPTGPGRRPQADVTAPNGALSRIATPGNFGLVSAKGSLDVPLPADTIDELRQHAAAMGVSAAALASSLLETISRDCLYSAVLDAD